jgi:Stage II sporulation protein E (SpoIIE)
VAGGDEAEQIRATLREARTARTLAELLARASTALASSMRPARALGQFARTLVPTLADVCAVHAAAPGGGLELLALAHAEAEGERAAREAAELEAADPDGASGPAAVIRTGLAEVGAHSVVLPLAARGAVLGALTLSMEPSGREYDADLLELANSLAAGAGLALDNARLFAEQSEVARTLQRTLLPSELPHVPGAELAARYRASGRSNQVGGDFYDVFPAGDGEWALVIGDVVGKGAEAAAITALVRATLQAATMRGDGPAAALHLVDEALRRRPTMQFCSALHGRLRATSGAGLGVFLLSAGHPTPLVLRGTGALEVVEVGGTLLGVTPQPRFGRSLLELAPGDTLLLYTDGATELRGTNPWRGEEALRETLLASVGVPLGDLVERVERQALVLSGGELRDDMALLAVRASRPADV